MHEHHGVDAIRGEGLVRVSLSLTVFGYHVGTLDVNLDEHDVPVDSAETLKVPIGARITKGVSRVWFKGMTS